MPERKNNGAARHQPQASVLLDRKRSRETVSRYMVYPRKMLKNRECEHTHLFARVSLWASYSRKSAQVILNVTSSINCGMVVDVTNDFAQQLESVAKVLFSQVDLCTCGIVRKYMKSSRNTIEDVLLVGEGLALVRVAGLFCERPNESAEYAQWKQSQISLLYESGQLLGLTWPQVSDLIFRWQDIPEDWPCGVICLPPYYVIQLKFDSATPLY